MCKFSQADFRRFRQRFLNVLENNEARKYFSHFVKKQLFKYKRAFKIWSKIEASKRKEPNINILEDEDFMELVSEADYLDGDETCEEMQSKSVVYLEKLHMQFMDYLEKKSRKWNHPCASTSTS